MRADLSNRFVFLRVEDNAINGFSATTKLHRAIQQSVKCSLISSRQQRTLQPSTAQLYVAILDSKISQLAPTSKS